MILVVSVDIIVNILLYLVHPALETLDSLAESAHQFRDLLSSEQEKDHKRNDNDFAGPKIQKQKVFILSDYYSNLLLKMLFSNRGLNLSNFSQIWIFIHKI